MAPFNFYIIDNIIFLLYNILVIILFNGGVVPLLKKLLAVLITTLLIFSSLVTVFATENTDNDITLITENEPNEEEKQEPVTITVGVITEPGTNKTGVVLRSDATKESDRITTLDDGTTLTVNGSKNDVSVKPETEKINPETNKLYVWYNVTYNSYTGYIREDLITVTTHVITPPNEEEEEIVYKSFEEQLAEFPENYHPYLTALHEQYPNWVFTADNISITYAEAIALENIFPRKLVENQYLSWRSMENGAFNWNTGAYAVTDGRWYGASREVIAYYMDPRNFLNTNDAYIFMKQSYDVNSQSIVGLRELLKGRFMANNYVDANDMTFGGDFALVIMEAARQAGVNPYILASILIQEQGTNGSEFAHGIKYNATLGIVATESNTLPSHTVVTVYNYFNFGVSGTTESEKLQNGAKYAYNSGWTTRSASIIGGAKKYADGYVNGNPTNPYYNQDTYFYKNYNILNPSKIYHQYAQNVSDQVSTASFLRKMYSDDKTTRLVFRIPVYKNNSLPETALKQPEKTANQNNYFFNTIEVEGLTPTFSRYTYSYALQIEADTTVYVNVPETASIISEMTYNLVKGDNKVVLTVKSATGYTNDYTINVNALADCVLTITTEKPTPPPPPEDGDGDGTGDGGTTTDPENPGGEGGEDGGDEKPDDVTPPTPPEPVIIKGDVNGDGQVTLSDMSDISLYLVNSIVLNGDSFIAADTNNDGLVTLSDLSNIALHLIGSINLNQ